MRVYRWGSGTVVSSSKLDGVFGKTRVEREQERLKKTQKIAEENKRYKNKELLWHNSLLRIKLSDLLEYAKGNQNVCVRGVPFNIPNLTNEERELIYSNPIWMEFTENAFNKAVYETYIQGYPGTESYNFHPESWNSLLRERNLVIKHILIDENSPSAKINEWKKLLDNS